jgi:hypothetical protein
MVPDSIALILTAAALAFGAMAAAQAIFRRFIIRRHISMKHPF